MKFSLALLALVPAVAFAAPLEPRQGGVAVNCGGQYYSASQVNRAINNAKSGQYSSSGYPHTYNNYEGFDFSDYCNGPYKEYPLKTSSSGYTGGSPGADRVVYDSNDGTFCGASSFFSTTCSLAMSAGPNLGSNSETGSSEASASTAGSIKSPYGDEAILTYDVLDEKQAIRSVADDGAGATVLFSGTTRDSFRGKQVTRLEYEAYSSLAVKTLQSLLVKAHTSAPFAQNPIPLSVNADPQAKDSSDDRIARCYIAHRLGPVTVGECSILIAVSSPHRKEAFAVAEWLLEEVKKNVAVWKREFYATGVVVTARDGDAGPLDPSRTENAGTDADASNWSWKANFPTT